MTTKKGLDLLKDPTLKEQYPKYVDLAREHVDVSDVQAFGSRLFNSNARGS